VGDDVAGGVSSGGGDVAGGVNSVGGDVAGAAGDVAPEGVGGGSGGMAMKGDIADGARSKGTGFKGMAMKGDDTDGVSSKGMGFKGMAMKGPWRDTVQHLYVLLGLIAGCAGEGKGSKASRPMTPCTLAEREARQKASGGPYGRWASGVLCLPRAPSADGFGP